MEWTCRCGAFAAEAKTMRGTRLVCYCPSCREFALRTGAGESLDAAGGSDLYQLAPEDAVIVRGADKLGRMKLTEKGPLRWFTTCCNTPVANTLGTLSLPFLTLQTHGFAEPDALGPVRARVFRDSATGQVPEGGSGATALYWNFAMRALRSRVTGGWKRNPFFGPNQKPIGRREEPAASGS